MRPLAFALVVSVASVVGFHATSRPLSAPLRKQIVAAGEWHVGCPVPLSQLRVLTVRYRGFDGRPHDGQLVVNRAAVAPLREVFRQLYALHFPIHHMQLSDAYGPTAGRPADADFSGSFECRQAVASPCTSVKSRGNGSWSNHAYGEAVDINPVENPYVGCGMTRNKKALSYLDRSRLRKGMVTAAVVRAFRSVGWGWGGAWTGSTKDYMHFSVNGR